MERKAKSSKLWVAVDYPSLGYGSGTCSEGGVPEPEYRCGEEWHSEQALRAQGWKDLSKREGQKLLPAFWLS